MSNIWITILSAITDYIGPTCSLSTLYIAFKVYRSLPEWLSKSNHEEVKNFFKIMTRVNTELCRDIVDNGYSYGELALYVPLFYPEGNQIAVIKFFLNDAVQEELTKRYIAFKTCCLKVWVNAKDESYSAEINNQIGDFYRYLTRLKFHDKL
ncbi:TPA: hypothetical protein ACV5EY_003957 [Klebsiella aerogenes]|uniref:hypothetical protein n=1 Tax=Klebsiella sp. 141161 TaxID=3020037 RepID=UPI000DDD458C|nr:hypothetical protein [Klebsiella aerogenes]HDS7116538.1 hypothetical protein [Klebsiella aerogenes]HDT5518518.1 hypothetical protein [Klebsiella aerogenes]